MPSLWNRISVDGRSALARCATLHAVATERDSSWAALVGVLESFALVSDRQPDGLVVTAERSEGSEVMVEIVMTHKEWENLVSTTFGELEPA